MKFELSLQYNSVPEWQNHYINYANLKKIVYALQAEELEKLSGTNNAEHEDENNKNQYIRFFHNKIAKQFRSSSDENNAKSSSSSGLDIRKSSKNLFNNINSKLKKNDSFVANSFELNNLSGSESADRKSNDYANDDDDDESEIESMNWEGPAQIFIGYLKTELAKIDDFYKLKEAQLTTSYNNLINDLESSKVHITDKFLNEDHSIFSNKSSTNKALLEVAEPLNFQIEKHHEDVQEGSSNDSDNFAGAEDETKNAEEDEDEFDEEEENIFSDEHNALLNEFDVNIKSQKIITLKKRTTQLYVDLCQLKSFIELNKLGFSKITKKFDKSLNTHIKQELFDNNKFFKYCHIFNHNTIRHLDVKITNLVEVYGSLTGQLDNLPACKAELKSFLREQIVWERNTVWKDMIGLEAKVGDVKAEANLNNNELFNLEFYQWKLPFNINLGFTQIKYFKLPKFINTSRFYKLFIIIAITAILLGVKTFNDEAQHRCMALLACVALLWATEAIPLFVTAMLCPLLCVLFRVVKDDKGHVMTAAKASSYVLSQMWSSTIMVLVGGFTLAAALSKYNVAKVLASYILAFSGTKPRNILLSVMGVSLFLAMWISNVATPVLCYSLIQGVLRTLTVDEPFAKALILGIALASNVAGMSSPISSPQNIVAMTYLDQYGIGWGQWLAVAIPVSIVATVLIWLLLILTFDVSKAKVMKYKPIKDKFTIKQWYVCFVSLITIIFWCVLTKMEFFGDAGEISVIPIVLLFGTGLLSTSDVNNFPWSIVLLAMGSLALGKAVSSSGLLSTIAMALEKKIVNYNIFVILMIFGILMLVIGTFVSHTVSAIIIIPLVQEIGDSLPGSDAATILIFGSALISSCGMGLASSGFPNVTAISMTDELGARYLNVTTFITRGVPASFIAYIVIITLGYGIIKSVA